MNAPCADLESGCCEVLRDLRSTPRHKVEPTPARAPAPLPGRSAVSPRATAARPSAVMSTVMSIKSSKPFAPARPLAEVHSTPT
jgi:hypothetical protein